MPESAGDALQDQDGVFGDFGADAVAREDGQVQEHAVSLAETALAVQNPGDEVSGTLFAPVRTSK